MQIKSVFENNGEIPEKYTCDGEDISPPLEIFDIPYDAKSLVLVMEDPDAPSGVFTHWILWNIPIKGSSLKIGENESLGIPGMNGAGKTSYLGPCPPVGVHRYYFKVYALNIELDLEEGSVRTDLEDEVLGKIIDNCQIIGTYER